MSLPQALIFDMDGLLLDTEGLYRTAWRKAAKEQGHDLTDEIYVGALGADMAAAERHLQEKFGPTFHLADFRPRAASYYQEVVESGIPLKPGVHELMRFADENDIKMAVGTAASQELAVDHLSSHGLVQRFGAIVGCDMVSKGKPDPETFTKAADMLDVPYAKCLVLEDGYGGIEGAKSAGMQAFFIPDMLHPSDDVVRLADGVFSSLLAVRDHLASFEKVRH